MMPHGDKKRASDRGSHAFFIRLDLHPRGVLHTHLADQQIGYPEVEETGDRAPLPDGTDSNDVSPMAASTHTIPTRWPH
jgi:hypothetical protein